MPLACTRARRDDAHWPRLPESAMRRTLSTRLLATLAFTLWLLAAAPGRAQDRPLVTPVWLERQLQAQAVLLLDASMPPQHAAGHIPGAVNATVFGLIGRDVAPAVFERQLRSWGVSPGQRIVVYDEGGSWMATRLFWDLHRHGVPLADLHLLDGGLHGWKAAGKPVTKDATPAPAPGTFTLTQVAEAMRVRLPALLTATGDPQRHVVVDALEAPYYYGGTKFFGDRAGHIPRAKLWPSSDFFDANTKTFKSRDEIRRMLAHHSIRAEQTVHVYCGGGGAASVPVFALRYLLGRDNVTLYDESLREGVQDERGLPLWSYAAPALLRGMAWLDGWSGPMVRMAGIARLSTIDLRAADAYRLGHVPFAVNIAPEVFRDHLQQPAELAAKLGAAGVDPRHEAVLVTDGGLTPAGALAALALERLGQPHVSLLTDSLDDWALGGLTIAKEPTVVGTRKTPQDLVVPAGAYPADRLRDALTTAAPPATGTTRVYVALGGRLPARLPPDAAPAAGSKVVHLPYTELLAANGVPKPAKDLWSLLAKAGVPRYAEIVCIADDPGEAAVGWFVLRLMGFERARVWSPV
jgi:thiosulfate/3-mercaptopyruvate sulfurtransferase